MGRDLAEGRRVRERGELRREGRERDYASWAFGALLHVSVGLWLRGLLGVGMGARVRMRMRVRGGVREWVG